MTATRLHVRALGDDGPMDCVDLLGRAMHRTRNLMMSIRGYAELISSGMTDLEQSQEWAAKIVGQIDRLESMQSRIDTTGVAERKTGKHSLALVARAAMERSRARCLSDVAVQLEVVDDVLVDADGEELAEAIAALIDNAREATLDRACEVSVRLEQDELHRWALSITDQGSGMSPATLSQVGQPFFTRKSGHAGLGLFLSRTLLGRHGMALEFAQDGEDGTVVTIRERRRPAGGIR